MDKKVHIIGICGKAMAGLAVMLSELGWQVSGSDEGFYDPVYSYLLSKNIKFYKSYKKENITDNMDMIVIGKHAKLTQEENEEVRYAFESGIQIKSLPEVMQDLTKDTGNTVVVGSFGKSTCTSIITWCLIQKGLDPSYMIGALPFGFENTSHIGKDDTFILEGDEYPSSNWDKTSKFLYYNANSVLLTSCEHDHINVFPTIESYIEPYKKLISKLKDKDLLIYQKNGANIQEVISESTAVKISYSLKNNADYYPLNIETGEVSSFSLYKNDIKIIDIKTTLMGMHNIENIVGCSALMLEKNLLTKEELQKGIESFQGVLGRLDQKKNNSSIKIFEGYGSSHAKLASLFESIKLHYPKKRIVTIFDPHTFSWRNKNALSWYKDCFSNSDVTLVYEPPTHGKDTHDQLSLSEIVDEIKKTKENVFAFTNKDEGLSILKRELKKDDIILMSTSGDLGGIMQEIPKLCEDSF